MRHIPDNSEQMYTQDILGKGVAVSLDPGVRLETLAAELYSSLPKPSADSYITYPRTRRLGLYYPSPNSLPLVVESSPDFRASFCLKTLAWLVIGERIPAKNGWPATKHFQDLDPHGPQLAMPTAMADAMYLRVAAWEERFVRERAKDGKVNPGGETLLRRATSLEQIRSEVVKIYDETVAQWREEVRRIRPGQGPKPLVINPCRGFSPIVQNWAAQSNADARYRCCKLPQTTLRQIASWRSLEVPPPRVYTNTHEGNQTRDRLLSLLDAPRQYYCKTLDMLTTEGVNTVSHAWLHRHIQLPKLALMAAIEFCGKSPRHNLLHGLLELPELIADNFRTGSISTRQVDAVAVAAFVQQLYIDTQKLITEFCNLTYATVDQDKPQDGDATPHRWISLE